MIAEITLSHVIRLGNEQGCPVSREQALAFLNQEGRAFEMWKHMMQAAEGLIAGSLFQHSLAPEHTTDLRLSHPVAHIALPRTSVLFQMSTRLMSRIEMEFQNRLPSMARVIVPLSDSEPSHLVLQGRTLKTQALRLRRDPRFARTPPSMPRG